MIYFENGLDFRTREQDTPCVAKFNVSPGVDRFIVIGTAYGYVHTSSGEIRTWGSYSGAYKFMKAYKPF